MDGYVLFLCWSCFIVWGVNAADVCPEGEPITDFDTQSETNPSVFDDLTADEIRIVYDYMKDVKKFNVKENHEITMDSTYVYLIERHPSPKADVLKFLHKGGEKPGRFAKVIMYRGDLPIPVIEEYAVGPLPQINGHTRLPISGKDSIAYIKRQYFSPADYNTLVTFIGKEFARIDHILRHKTGGYTFNNCSTKCLAWLPGMPGRFIADDRSVWVYLLRNVEGFFLHPVGLEILITMGEHLHMEDWRVDLALFRGKSYKDLEEMAANYVESGLPDPPVDGTSTNLYSSLNQRGEPLPTKKQRGPSSFMPDGRRYSVEGHHVKWQGWRFDFNMRSTIGLQVHDVRFKNERIAYELGISEIGIVYAGPTPAARSVYTDSMFPIGQMNYELVEGIDCPDYSTYFDFAHFVNFKPIINKRSACVFEMNKGVPMRHHYDSDFAGNYNHIQGMPNNVLVLRSVITAYNYEYILDYQFHQNGAVEVVVSLSGYILSGFHTGDPASDRYGFKVFPNGHGQIHNHFVHLKADIDVGQTNNRFETFDIKTDQVKDPTSPTDDIVQQIFERNLRRTEKNATYKVNFDTPKYLVFYNNDDENKYGNKKGYRLYPVHVNKQLLPEGWAIENGLSWARYQVAVTQHKDSEQRGSSEYNVVDNVDPVVNFQKFIDDDENIVDEDLVAWVSLGAFHIPHSEDIPIVQTPSLSLTYFLLPYNYFDEDPSLASRDNIRVTPNKDGSQNLHYVDVSPEVTCRPKSMTSTSVAIKAYLALNLLVFSILIAFN